MTVWVIRGGRLVEKTSVEDAVADRRPIFPTPHVSRLEPYESPITGKEISSWRERDRELAANDCYDPRDRPGHVYSKGRTMKEADNNGREQRRSEPSFQWTDLA